MGSVHNQPLLLAVLAVFLHIVPAGANHGPGLNTRSLDTSTAHAKTNGLTAWSLILPHSRPEIPDQAVFDSEPAMSTSPTSHPSRPVAPADRGDQGGVWAVPHPRLQKRVPLSHFYSYPILHSMPGRKRYRGLFQYYPILHHVPGKRALSRHTDPVSSDQTDDEGPNAERAFRLRRSHSHVPQHDQYDLSTEISDGLINESGLTGQKFHRLGVQVSAGLAPTEDLSLLETHDDQSQAVAAASSTSDGHGRPRRLWPGYGPILHSPPGKRPSLTRGHSVRAPPDQGPCERACGAAHLGLRDADSYSAPGLTREVMLKELYRGSAANTVQG